MSLSVRAPRYFLFITSKDFFASGLSGLRAVLIDTVVQHSDDPGENRRN